jgi:hypothetical protein
MTKIDLSPNKYLVVISNKDSEVVKGFNNKKEALRLFRRSQKEGNLIYFANIEKTNLDGKTLSQSTYF